MATIKHFTELDTSKKAHSLRLQIIKLLVKFPSEYQFGLCAQLQRSSISVASNIAEGFGRKSEKEKLRFYNIAEGSLTEVQDQLVLCKELSLIKSEISNDLLKLSEEVHMLIHGLMRYIRNTNSEMRDTNE